MRITILGSAAGGGFPQWNCNCRNCAGVRSGAVRAKPRTQSSIFVQGEPGVDGVLLNASPDILEQIRSHPVLQPGRALRDTAIAGVVLMDGQVDHVTGLFMLRERSSPAPSRLKAGERPPGGLSPQATGGQHSSPLPLWCTDPVAEDLTQGNPVLRVLAHYCGVQRHAIALDGSAFTVPGAPKLSFRAIALSSKAAPYSPHRDAPVPGDNIGLLISDASSGRSCFYAPGLGEITPALFDVMGRAAAVLVDGTFWSDDEMPRLGLSRKSARDIGHLPQSGPGGMIEWLARLPAATRRLLIHINNTNPILDEDSAERGVLAQQRIEVCEDRMTLDI